MAVNGGTAHARDTHGEHGAMSARLPRSAQSALRLRPPRVQSTQRGINATLPPLLHGGRRSVVMKQTSRRQVRSRRQRQRQPRPEAVPSLPLSRPPFHRNVGRGNARRARSPCPECRSVHETPFVHVANGRQRAAAAAVSPSFTARPYAAAARQRRHVQQEIPASNRRRTPGKSVSQHIQPAMKAFVFTKQVAAT